MFQPWLPEWLGEMDYDCDGNPTPSYTLEDFARISNDWVRSTVEAHARFDKASIAAMANAARNWYLPKKACRIGMVAAMNAALAQMPDAHTLPPDVNTLVKPAYARPTRWRSHQRLKYRFWRWVAHGARRVADFATLRAW